jgi:hypothetical protein
MLPGFVKGMKYLRDTSGLEILAFLPLVKFRDVNRTERFLMDAWAADPLVPANAGLRPLPGIYGVNESNNRAPYKDTTKVTWNAQKDVLLPVAQMLFDSDIPPMFLGWDLHATSNFGPWIEEIMDCTGIH